MSKKLLTSLCLVTLVTTSALAMTTRADDVVLPEVEPPMASENSKKSLMAKLAQIDFFSANFKQKSVSESGELLQEGAGTIAMSKPNLVHWKITEPDEVLMLSDGQTVWVYDPFLDQATAYALSKYISKTPVLLLMSNDESLWDLYHISQVATRSGDHVSYMVTAIDKTSQIKSLTLSFKGKQLNEFSFKDATGQMINIILTHFNAVDKPSDSLFKFTLPDGVHLEDKR